MSSVWNKEPLLERYITKRFSNLIISLYDKPKLPSCSLELKSTIAEIIFLVLR